MTTGGAAGSTTRSGSSLATQRKLMHSLLRSMGKRGPTMTVVEAVCLIAFGTGIAFVAVLVADLLPERAR
jgi:hypothetical protein